VEGSAARTTDDSLLSRLARNLGVETRVGVRRVRGSVHDRGTETGGAAHVYAVAPTKVLAFGKGEPFSQTRYRFS
jgi:hypothetical protein